MKILVIGGSPKGKESVTVQYARYIEKKFPDCEFAWIYPAQKIRGLEQYETKWNEAADLMRNAEAILWAFPLYYFLVHAGLKRFIELLFERGGNRMLSGKYCASLSTSIHFFDNTAHDYIRSVSEDLGMRFVQAHSPKMDDLFSAGGRTQTERFFRTFLQAVDGQRVIPRSSRPLNFDREEALFAQAPEKIATGKSVLILTDLPSANKLSPDEKNLDAMTQRIASSIDGNVERLSILDMGISGNCMGCLRCGDKNICTYEGKDGFAGLYKEKLGKSDVIIFCGTIKDRYLSAAWKRFFDRSFFNTHQPSLTKKHFGFVISGPLSQTETLRQVLQGYTELQDSQLCGMVSDEKAVGTTLADRLDGLTAQIIGQANEEYFAPQTFFGVGGMKVFRDDIFANLKMVFRADHRAYKKLGIYDYIQSKPLKRLGFSIAHLLTGIPFIKKQLYAHMIDGMIAPYKKIIKRAG